MVKILVFTLRVFPSSGASFVTLSSTSEDGKEYVKDTKFLIKNDQATSGSHSRNEGLTFPSEEDQMMEVEYFNDLRRK
jgi:hypothetical protein